MFHEFEGDAKKTVSAALKTKVPEPSRPRPRPQTFGFKAKAWPRGLHHG